MITQTLQRVEYRGYLITETIRTIAASTEDVRLRRWAITFVDASGIDTIFGDATDLDGAKRKIDRHLSRELT